MILVNAGPTDRNVNAALAGLLATQFTVLNYDRRGRGDSGDNPPYAVDREYEDLDAVIAASGGSAYAFGNSGGGILALDAAARGLAITKLAVWEPPYILDGTRRQCRRTTGSSSATCWPRVAGATWSSCS